MTGTRTDTCTGTGTRSGTDRCTHMQVRLSIPHLPQTIGDSYMVVGGAFDLKDDSHFEAIGTSPLSSQNPGEILPYRRPFSGLADPSSQGGWRWTCWQLSSR